MGGFRRGFPVAFCCLSGARSESGSFLSPFERFEFPFEGAKVPVFVLEFRKIDLEFRFLKKSSGFLNVPTDILGCKVNMPPFRSINRRGKRGNNAI